MAGLDTLVSRYQAGALRLAYLLTGDYALAEDITQDGFIQVFQRIDRFELDRPFAPWLLGIVANLARERLRSHRRLREVRLDGSPLAPRSGDADADDEARIAQALYATATDPAARAVRSEQRDALLDALNALTQKQREAIILRYYLGYGDLECAALAGCREGAFRVRLHDGLRALKVVIRQRYPWLLPVGSSSGDTWEVPRHVAL